MDFTEDDRARGRKFRTASLKDDGTRACPAILVDPSLPGSRVVGMLDQAAGERGCPDMPGAVADLTPAMLPPDHGCP